MAAQSGPKVIGRRRCLEPGCPQEGVWQDVFEGEEYLLIYEAAPGEPLVMDKRSHAWAHYVEREVAYQRRRQEELAARRTQYRETGRLPR